MHNVIVVSETEVHNRQARVFVYGFVIATELAALVFMFNANVF